MPVPVSPNGREFTASFPLLVVLVLFFLRSRRNVHPLNRHSPVRTSAFRSGFRPSERNDRFIIPV
ncbi:hypothetical protein B4135_3886 [Caldibacillus debilis]|uniref:Uncharacterized protein n=1 Tax=Caldibacillus debilis TaxID=301148 RepID=A0A150L9P2_9BACI|nr:hypothetical protein B4135_3886 [Caldibacillus debilis]